MRHDAGQNEDPVYKKFLEDAERKNNFEVETFGL